MEKTSPISIEQIETELRMVIINYLIFALFPLGMGSDKVLRRSNADLEGNFDNHES